MLNRVLNYARNKKLDFEIIPVDDRSTDKTPLIIAEFANKYSKNISPIFRKDDSSALGNTMGFALVEGTKASKGNIIIWTMGDMADDTNTYTDIIDKIKKGNDMIFGSRYMSGGSRGNLDPLKAFLSSWGTIIARLLFGVPVHDITNAFRGFKRKVFAGITLRSSDFSISPEFAIKAHLAGFKLAETPTFYTNRTAGISSFKLYNMTLSYLKLYIDLYFHYKILRRSDEIHQ
jgi:glycosyltransferase involved in cell wall biosynthesis